MICNNMVSKYCSDDISLIENYEQALNDATQTWDCHHKLEIELNKGKQELIDLNLYYDRPAPELIFLTHSEHRALHNKQRLVEKHPLYGKQRKEETRNKIRELQINTKYMCKNNIKKRIKLNEIHNYLNDGWKICKYKKREING